MSLVRLAPTSSLPVYLSNVCLRGYELFRIAGGDADLEQYKRRFDLALSIPFSDEIIEQYDPAKERIRAQSYRLDQSLHEHTSTPTTAAATAASPSSHSSKPPKTKKVTAKASTDSTS
jgi:hypothetical protein